LEHSNLGRSKGNKKRPPQKNLKVNFDNLDGVKVDENETSILSSIDEKEIEIPVEKKTPVEKKKIVIPKTETPVEKKEKVETPVEKKTQKVETPVDKKEKN